MFYEPTYDSRHWVDLANLVVALLCEGRVEQAMGE